MINRRSFICGIKGSKLTNRELIFINTYRPWGIILFSINFKNFKQSINLIIKIKTTFKDRKYPILIDQEGGRVNRLDKFLSLNELTAEYFGKLYIKDKRQFDLLYKLFIDKTCHLLLSLGININIVPVLDIKYKGSSNIIGDRLLKQPTIVSKIEIFVLIILEIIQLKLLLNIFQATV